MKKNNDLKKLDDKKLVNLYNTYNNNFNFQNSYQLDRGHAVIKELIKRGLAYRKPFNDKLILFSDIWNEEA